MTREELMELGNKIVNCIGTEKNFFISLSTTCETQVLNLVEYFLTLAETMNTIMMVAVYSCDFDNVET